MNFSFRNLFRAHSLFFGRIYGIIKYVKASKIKASSVLGFSSNRDGSCRKKMLAGSRDSLYHICVARISFANMRS